MFIVYNIHFFTFVFFTKVFQGLKKKTRSLLRKEKHFIQYVKINSNLAF